MLFNSVTFIIFMMVVFPIYWAIPSKKLPIQNFFLLIASYFFYACWNWEFLSLLVFSTFLDYYSGIKIHTSKQHTKRKYWLIASIVINLSILGVFKYFNFFIESFSEAFSLIGIKTNIYTLNLILPIGISFYTFHGISYVIDIYKSKITPERNFINYGVFVSFFPLLVAGPIERASHLLPQIVKPRVFNYEKAVNGLKQILWGLFKKIVIADQCAEQVDLIFNNSANHSGSTLFIGALYFSFQIYGDFSGYSDIALGVARLLGIDLIRNFSFPYFSRDVAEFWRRWHISLSSWFRDYLYIPLGGSKVDTVTKIRNVFIIFLISGLWHGAKWTFIVWGLLNAMLIIPSFIFNSNRQNLDIASKGKILPSIKDIFSILSTFILITFTWIFFRSSSLQQALDIIKEIFSKSLFSIPTIFSPKIGLIISIFMLIEWIGREREFAIEYLGSKLPKAIRWAIYYAISHAVIIYAGSGQQFIYFQF